ncbi:MAG: hypothetical protein K6G43_00185 [Lachnospiraceae bacterium]|nr:hypothetical protein [Lachnospiraceae bacterium]
MSVPVSFGVLESTDSDIIHNPIVALEAIRRCSDKLLLFCNVDGIKLPQDVRPIYSLLENSVVPVNLGKGVNFHPKMWVIRYENDTVEIIRIIILSRNLTFDRSMDIAVEMTGIIDREKKRMQKKHQPIADLLNYLAEKTADKVKREEIAQLAQDVLLVNRFDIDDQYEEYNFLPVGFPGYENRAEGFFADATSILIVSPFLSRHVLDKMTKDACSKILITRLSSLNPNIYGMFDEVYVPVSGIENDNPLEEGEPDAAPKRELHAKVVYKECPNGDYLYLGSLNATANAFYHNIELMLELKFRPYITSLKSVKADFVEDKNSAFQLLLHEPDACEPEEGEEMVDFSDVEEAVSSAKVYVKDGGYCTELRVDGYKWNAEIKPLFGKSDYKRLRDEIKFERMTLKELSEFYAVKKKDQTRILIIDTKGIPVEERDNAVFNSIFDTKPKFLQYILFLLSDDPAMAMVENDDFIRGLQGKSDSRSQQISPEIYEKLLFAAAKEPEKLKAVEEVLKRVDKKVFDGDEMFGSMLKVFVRAVEGR